MPDVGGIAGAQLKSFIERIERLEDEKRALGEDIKEVYAEAKGSGFEPKIMRQIIKIRRMDKEEPDEQETLLQTRFEYGAGERVSRRGCRVTGSTGISEPITALVAVSVRRRTPFKKSRGTTVRFPRGRLPPLWQWRGRPPLRHGARLPAASR
jgi:uncharacterized protein (UPF0335 family)